jgi:MipA family protein
MIAAMMRPRFLALILALAASSSFAGDGAWSVGVLAFGETGAYRGAREQPLAVPYAAYDSERFHFGVDDGLAWHALGWGQPGQQGGRLSVIVAPRWEPWIREEQVFDGLDRDIAVEAGVRGRHYFGAVFVEAAALHDVSGVHDGFEAVAAVGLTQGGTRSGVEAKLGTRHRDANLNNHLFGVPTVSATALRPAYDARATTTGFASIGGFYGLSEHFTLIGNTEFQQLGKASGSPLLDADWNMTFSLGVVYRF